jgi:hypothetical protein
MWLKQRVWSVVVVLQMGGKRKTFSIYRRQTDSLPDKFTVRSSLAPFFMRFLIMNLK